MKRVDWESSMSKIILAFAAMMLAPECKIENVFYKNKYLIARKQLKYRD